MKYGTQSQAGSAHSPVTLFGNTKRDRSFPPPSVWRRSKNTNYPKCWKGLPISQCPVSLGWLGHKAKQQNTNYPNRWLWLVRRRHKMNIWLKCYSVKRRGDHLLMNLINVPAISSLAVYYFHFVSFVCGSVCSPSLWYFSSVEQSVPPRTSEFAFTESES